MAIRSTGVGSGLDVEGIVSQLMAVEQQPLARLQTKEAGVQSQISGIGTLSSVLSTFSDSVNALTSASTFNSSTVNISNEDVLSVSASTSAAPGTLYVEVLRLAQNHRMASAAKSDTDTFGGNVGDSLQITAGTTGTLTIDLSTAKTLTEIADLINADTNGVGVTATLLDETGDGSAQRLILNATESGSGNSLSLAYGGTIDVNTFEFANLNRDENDVVIADLSNLDASLEVDGFAITRSTNSIDDVVTGLTFDLAAVGESQVVVARDDSAVTGAVTAMVESYNEMKSQLNALGQGVLNGDSLLRSIEGGIRRIFNTSFAGFGDFSTLAELGVITTQQGSLEFDASKLTSALSDNSISVASFFTDENGFAETLVTTLDSYLESDGLVDARLDGLRSRVDDLQSQQARWEDRLIDIEARYRAQFTALDTLVAELTTTSNFLLQQLDNLPGANSSNN